MTDIIATAYQTLLRDSHPHAVLHYMSIYQPTLVYVGTVSGSPTRGDRSITMSNVSGSIASVRAEDTVFVGTASGDHSKSIRRLRTRVGQVLTVDENSVPWASGDYITVYHDMRLWGRWPRIYQSGDNWIFTKDYDITYLDQNLRPPPVAIMGWHRAKFMDGTSVTFVLDSTGSYAAAFGASISSRVWSCSTGTIANSSAASTTITFYALGQHEVQLAVTDSNGYTTQTRRIFFVHDRPGPNAIYPPFIDFDISSGVSLDWSSGSGRLSIEMHGDDVADISDNTLILLWGENYFEGTVNSSSMLAGSSYPASIANDGPCKVKFVGYLGRQQIAESDYVGKVSVEAYTVDYLMKRTNMASVSLTNVTTPTKWFEMYKMTVPRIVHHYLMYHSNIFSIADVILPMSTDLNELYASDDLVDGSLYQSVDTFTYQHGTFHHLSCDKWGRIHLAKDIETYDTADRAAISNLFTLGKIDIRMSDEQSQSSIEIVRDTQNRVDLMTVRGYSYVAGVNTPLISQAPGEIPESSGDSPAIFERLVFADQNNANMLSGRLFAIANREFVELRLALAGNYYDVLDIVPQYFVYIAPGVFDNLIDRDISGKYVIKTINYTPGAGGVVETQLTLEPDVTSIDGITIQWPVDPDDIVPPDDRPDPPPTPLPPPPPTPPPPITGQGALVCIPDVAQATSDITVASPVWVTKT
jgi:hypothetical protein